MTISPSLARSLCQAATLSSTPAIVSGKRAEPTGGTGIMCALLTPASGDTLTRPELNSPYKKYETFVANTQVNEGDILAINGVNYSVKIVDDFPGGDDTVTHLVLELDQAHA